MWLTAFSMIHTLVCRHATFLNALSSTHIQIRTVLIHAMRPLSTTVPTHKTLSPTQCTHSGHRSVGGRRPASRPAVLWCLRWRGWSELLLAKGCWWTGRWISVLPSPCPPHGRACPGERTAKTGHVTLIYSTVMVGYDETGLLHPTVSLVLLDLFIVLLPTMSLFCACCGKPADLNWNIKSLNWLSKNHYHWIHRAQSRVCLIILSFGSSFK